MSALALGYYVPPCSYIYTSTIAIPLSFCMPIGINFDSLLFLLSSLKHLLFSFVFIDFILLLFSIILILSALAKTLPEDFGLALDTLLFLGGIGVIKKKFF